LSRAHNLPILPHLLIFLWLAYAFAALRSPIRGASEKIKICGKLGKSPCFGLQ